MKKLELKELKGYLGTGLKIFVYGDVLEMTLDDEMESGTVCLRDVIEGNLKPILHPLSDLTKYCDDLGFVPSDLIDGTDLRWMSVNDINEIKLYTYNWLLERHFDIHNLIQDNLAIDINTIK